ncbi:DoxX family protein [Nocardia thailandica]
MTVTTADPTPDEDTGEAPVSAWHPAALLAFRFAVAYLGLFCLWFAQITFVFLGVAVRWVPEDLVAWQMLALDPASRWVGEHVFGVDAALRLNGSGDQAGIWIQTGFVLLAAVVITVVWSVRDRRRTAYPRLAAWGLTLLRLAVAGQLLFYGFAKLIPSQMPEPELTALLSRVGDLSPMALLWTQVGASPAYEMALGAAEVTAGLLLFWPRTATAGALLSVVSMAQVFLLNLTYDVPVKILSGHLLLMSLVLLAPQARRLANVLVLQRPSEPMTQPELFADPRRRRWATGVQLALGAWITAACVVLGLSDWHENGGGAPKPELYGIWEVEEFRADGAPLPALVDDPSRWRRLVVDRGTSAYQRMDDRLVAVTVTTDTPARTLTLATAGAAEAAEPAEPAEPYASFTVDRPAPDRLVLRGRVGQTPAEITLRAADPERFPLRGTGFRWVQNAPYIGGE